MPPKKKQQEIDFSTLPPWVSKNVIILCSGSSSRKQSILSQIKSYPNKMVKFIDQSEIIQHAKTKQLYVDITTLTEKQKKELKPDTPTQLNEEVKAKSFTSLISQLNVNNRVERKNKLDALNQPPPDLKKVPPKKDAKKEEKEPEPVVQKQYNKLFDSVYVVEKYPQSVEDVKEMDKEGEVINYVILINPQLIYPEEQQQEQQQQEQYQQNNGELTKKRQPKYPRQQLTSQDIANSTQISNFLTLIRTAKKFVPIQSQFRNCLIKQIKIDINIDKEQQEIKNIPEFIFEQLCELSLQRASYEDWLKVKVRREFVKREHGGQEEGTGEYAFDSPLDMLVEIASSIENIIRYPKKYKEQSKERELQLIERLFDDQVPVIPSFKNIQHHNQPQQNEHFNENYWPAPQKIFKKERKDIFEKLMLPGIDRTLMPEIPDKSYQRRKYEESTYVNFIKGDFGDFERTQTITEFEKLLEKVDPSKYCFNDRVYEEYHNKESIIDTFTKIFLHDPEILSKYDEKTDSLYVAVFYKNPDSRENYRKWVGDWKTTPNFDNWFNHIKNNEVNYKNNVFYNIDDTKLGKIVESTKETSPYDGSIVVQRVQQACDDKKIDIKIIREEEVFGIKGKEDQVQFWYTNYGHRVTVSKDNDKFSITITLLSGLIIVLNEKGHVYQRHGKQSIKTLPSGFTIVYNDHKAPKILHPNGGLTTASESFSNPIGLGVQYPNALKEIPTLKRTNTTHSVTKREDQTVIVEERQNKWIKFYDGTTYQISKDSLKIDKKGFAQGSINNSQIRYSYEDVEINGVAGQQSQYSFDVVFKDGSRLAINNQGVLCFNHQGSDEYYKCDFESKELTYQGKQTKSFKIENIENYQIPEQEHKTRDDFTEPRLFLIKNDNTAAEFFSEKQLKKYFQDKEGDVNTVIKRTQQSKHEIVQVTSRIYPRPNVQPISPNYPYDIDVIPAPKEGNIKSSNTISTLRIFVKLHPLTETDRESYNETLNQQVLWKAQKIKSDNQFGYCAKDSDGLQREMQEIKRMIERRREAVREYPYNQLRDKLLSELVELVVLEEKQFLKNQSGGFSFKKSLKKLNSQKFDKDSLQNQQQVPQFVQQKQGAFVSYTPCTNYFQTPIGQAALSQMPAFIFQPRYQAPQIPSIQVENNSQRMFSSKTVSRAPHSAPVPILPDSTIQNGTQSPFFQPSMEKTDNNVSRVSQKQIIIKPSVFTQQDIEEEKRAFEEEKKAYQKRALKRKDVDVYGKERVDKPVVPTLLRTQPVSEVNQKYILTESITEQKVKISSMKSRMMMNSSNLSELRKQGPHQAMMKSIDMSNTLEQIYQKRTQMVHANIKDSLSRDILILPAEANFGVVKENSFYEIKLDVKNQDVMCQRIAIKRAKTSMVKAFLNQMGPIPLGISRKVIVQLKTSSEMKGKFIDEFEIVSKHEIYKIPVTAQIVSEEAFYSMSLKQPKQSLLKIGVSQLKIQSNVRGLKMNISQLPKI